MQQRLQWTRRSAAQCVCKLRGRDVQGINRIGRVSVLRRGQVFYQYDSMHGVRCRHVVQCKWRLRGRSMPDLRCRHVVRCCWCLRGCRMPGMRCRPVFQCSWCKRKHMPVVRSRQVVRCCWCLRGRHMQGVRSRHVVQCKWRLRGRSMPDLRCRPVFRRSWRQREHMPDLRCRLLRVLSGCFCMCHVPDGKCNQSYEQSYRQFCLHRLQNGVLQGSTRRPAVRHMCGWHISTVHRPVDLHAVRCGPVLAFSRRNDAYGLPSVPAGQVLCRGQNCLHRLRAWKIRGVGRDDELFSMQ
jgi:hypothetical protein